MNVWMYGWDVFINENVWIGDEFYTACHDSDLYTSHTCWCQPLVNGEYQHQLQLVAFTG